MIFGEESENLAVESDIALFEHRDELGVGHVVLFEESGHTHVPEAAEITFLIFAVVEGISAGVENGFVGLTLLGAAPVAVAFDLG